MNFKELTHAKYFKHFAILTFIVFSFLGWLTVHIYGEYFSSTDDAYINANVVQIAPRVTGKIDKVNVSNNQHVDKGQILFTIDAVPFQTALDYAQSQVQLQQAQLTKAANTSQRIQELFIKKYASQQDSDNAIAALKTAQSSLAAANANLIQAQLNLGYTVVKAPVSGWLTNFNLREGDIVTIDQPLFALVDESEFWADANFKETEMENIKPGQHATIVTDLYPKHEFSGFVESISSGAGNAFSLLPPQNATGNWVKVTQRVPVKVRIINPDPNYPLRVGVSANVTIDLNSTT